MRIWLRRSLCVWPAMAAAALYLLLPHFPQAAEHLFARGVFRVLSVPLGGAVAFLPFSLTEIIVVASVPIGLFLTIRLIVRLIRSVQRAAIFGNAARRLVWLLSCVLLMYMLLHGANYYRYTAAQLMELPSVKPEPERLLAVCIDLADKAAVARELVEEDSDGVMRLSEEPIDVLRSADSGFRALEERYPFLYGGVWRAKPVWLSHYWSYTGITGMYCPMLCEANVNTDIPDCDIPFTAAHELAHTRGFAREDECNFFAYLTAIHSTDSDLRYSGYMTAYVLCVNALYAYDAEMAEQAAGHCSEGMWRDFAARSRYWDQFKGPVQEISEQINDGFIKVQGVEAGQLSYGLAVDLIVKYYAQGGAS